MFPPEPHGGALFDALAQPTALFDTPGALNLRDTDRAAMLPRRKRTRAQDRQDRINAERRERTELIAQQERQRQAWLAQNYQPPPF